MILDTDILYLAIYIVLCVKELSTSYTHTHEQTRIIVHHLF